MLRLQIEHWTDSVPDQEHPQINTQVTFACLLGITPSKAVPFTTKGKVRLKAALETHSSQDIRMEEQTRLELLQAQNKPSWS